MFREWQMIKIKKARRLISIQRQPVSFVRSLFFPVNSTLFFYWHVSTLTLSYSINDDD